MQDTLRYLEILFISFSLIHSNFKEVKSIKQSGI